jgi:hypothetical protein
MLADFQILPVAVFTGMILSFATVVLSVTLMDRDPTKS